MDYSQICFSTNQNQQQQQPVIIETPISGQSFFASSFQQQQQPFYGHGQQLPPNLLTSTSWSSSSSSGLEETQLDVLLDDGSSSIEITTSTTGAAAAAHVTQPQTLASATSDFLSDTGSQMMIEATTSTVPLQNDTQIDFINVLDLQQDASIQMWQFLLECLDDRRFRHIIRWTSTNSTNSNSNLSSTSTGGVSSLSSSRRRPANTTTTDHSSFEFCILEPRELARFWAARKYGYYYQVGGAMASNTNTNNNNINYFQRFNRVLRYYLNKKRLLHKIVGKSNTYVFLINVQPFLNNLTNRSRTFA